MAVILFLKLFSFFLSLKKVTTFSFSKHYFLALFLTMKELFFVRAKPNCGSKTTRAELIDFFLIN